jgi:flagellar biogenesis protein FliO
MKIRYRIALVTLLGAVAPAAPSLAQGLPAGSAEAAAPVAPTPAPAPALEPPPALALPTVAGSDVPAMAAGRAPDALVDRGNGARSWLARGGGEPPPAAAPESSSTSMGLTLGAVVILLGLASAAIYMRFKRQTTLPLSPSESRLTVLSSSRVGPKAFAVTAHVGGRVLLLGVTDQNVTNLGWLDPPEAEPPASTRDRDNDEPENDADELPDDYPGSALRVSNTTPLPFATAHELKRFHEVLRGAVPSRTELPIRPSYPARPAPDAATTLAAQTTDVVAAAAPPAVQTSLSLRRKRRGGRESVAPREPRAATPNRTPQASGPSVEGQVAGLRALRNGG